MQQKVPTKPQHPNQAHSKLRAQLSKCNNPPNQLRAQLKPLSKLHLPLPTNSRKLPTDSRKLHKAVPDSPTSAHHLHHLMVRHKRCMCNNPSL